MQVTIGKRFQGPTGSGQGGYTAGLVAAEMTGPLQADFHRRIPLERPMAVTEAPDGHRSMVDSGEVVVRVAPVNDEIPVPPVVGLDEAAAARSAYSPWGPEAVPFCFSCGVQDESFQVWAGPVGDGTYFASPWTPPAWTAPDGVVEAAYVWAAIDCPAGAKTCFDGPELRVAVTGAMTAELLHDVHPETPHVIVAWADRWKGRRRVSGAALFTGEGRLLARQRSLWISID